MLRYVFKYVYKFNIPYSVYLSTVCELSHYHSYKFLDVGNQKYNS